MCIFLRQVVYGDGKWLLPGAEGETLEFFGQGLSDGLGERSLRAQEIAEGGDRELGQVSEGLRVRSLLPFERLSSRLGTGRNLLGCNQQLIVIQSIPLRRAWGPRLLWTEWNRSTIMTAG